LIHAVVVIVVVARSRNLRNKGGGRLSRQRRFGTEIHDRVNGSEKTLHPQRSTGLGVMTEQCVSGVHDNNGDNDVIAVVRAGAKHRHEGAAGDEDDERAQVARQDRPVRPDHHEVQEHGSGVSTEE